MNSNDSSIISSSSSSTSNDNTTTTTMTSSSSSSSNNNNNNNYKSLKISSSSYNNNNTKFQEQQPLKFFRCVSLYIRNNIFLLTILILSTFILSLALSLSLFFNFYYFWISSKSSYGNISTFMRTQNLFHGASEKICITKTVYDMPVCGTFFSGEGLGEIQEDDVTIVTHFEEGAILWECFGYCFCSPQSYVGTYELTTQKIVGMTEIEARLRYASGIVRYMLCNTIHCEMPFDEIKCENLMDIPFTFECVGECGKEVVDDQFINPIGVLGFVVDISTEGAIVKAVEEFMKQCDVSAMSLDEDSVQCQIFDVYEKQEPMEKFGWREYERPKKNGIEDDEEVEEEEEEEEEDNNNDDGSFNGDEEYM